MIRAAIIVRALAGCVSPWSGWDDVPEARVHVTSELPAFGRAWEAQVARDVASWNTELVAIGCPAPFVLEPSGGHAITLVPFGTFDPGVAGICDHERIRVRAAFLVVNDRVIDHPVLLLHELGHAIGLRHADAIHGASAMTPEPTADELLPRDIDAAACVLGCGPCDHADPYDGD